MSKPEPEWTAKERDRMNRIYAKRMKGRTFEDADVPAEGRLNVMKPETIVAGYGSTAAWCALPGSASGRDDKVMRQFPADIAVAPLRSIGEVAGAVVRKARGRA